jgi:hypothetical protein
MLNIVYFVNLGVLLVMAYSIVVHQQLEYSAVREASLSTAHTSCSAVVIICHALRQLPNSLRCCALTALCIAVYTIACTYYCMLKLQELEDHLIGVLTPFSLEVLRGGGGNGGGYLEVRPQGVNKVHISN